MIPILLWSAALGLPPGAPVPEGSHPRLTVTLAEIDRVRQTAAEDASVRRAVEQLVGAGESALEPAVEELPPLDDGANDSLIQQAVALGYAGVLADRDDCARRAAEILLLYADAYPTRPADAEGRVHRYSLQEAIWVCRAAVAADLVFARDVLSAPERQHIVDDLLRPAAVTVQTDRRSRPDHKDGHHQCYNFQAWHCAAVGLVGFLLGDQRLIDWAVEGEYGFRHMVAHDVRDDGLFWERSPGYHSFVISASSQLCEAAARNGLDLWNLEAADNLTEDEWGSGNWTLDGDNGPKRFGMMLEAPLDLLLPDLKAPAISDSGSLGLSSLGAGLALGYLRTGSAPMARMLRLLADQAPPGPPGWGTFAPEGSPELTGSRDGDRQVPTIENGSPDDRGAWVSPRVPTQGASQVNVRLQYRTVGCTAATPVRVRVVNYHAGRADPERFAMLDLPATEAWADIEKPVSLPEGTDQIGLEPFLWKAAGRVEMTDFEVAAEDGRVLLAAAEFGGGSEWLNTEGLPWNWVRDVAEAAPPAADGSFGTTGLRLAGCSLFPATGLAVLREKWLDPQATAAVLSYGPHGGGHGHPAMLELVVHCRGKTVLPALGTASYESPLHDTWTNTTVAHNTVVADRTIQWPRSKWGHDTADHQVCGELLAFHADERLRLVRARCDNAYDGVELDRAILMADGALLDVYRVRATDGAERQFDYVLHGLSPLSLADLNLMPSEAPSDADGYQHLSALQAARTDSPIRAIFGGCLQLVTSPADTEVVTAMGLGIAGTQPLPVLLLSRTGSETTYAVAMQPADDTRPLGVVGGDERSTLSVGAEAWTLDLPSEGGATVTCGDTTWRIGAPGEPTTRRGGGRDRAWEPVRTGNVRVP